MPAYADPDIVEPVTVQMIVTSSNKFSEPHNFVYTPKSAFGPGALAMASTLASLHHAAHSNNIQGIFTVTHNYLQNIFSLWEKKKVQQRKKKKTLNTHKPYLNDAVSRYIKRNIIKIHKLNTKIEFI